MCALLVSNTLFTIMSAQGTEARGPRSSLSSSIIFPFPSLPSYSGSPWLSEPLMGHSLDQNLKTALYELSLTNAALGGNRRIYAIRCMASLYAVESLL